MLNTCTVCKFKYQVRPYRAEQSKFCSYNCYWGKSSNLLEKECKTCTKTLSINMFDKVGRGWQSSCKNCRKKEWRNWSRRNDVKNRFRMYQWNSKKVDRDFEIDIEQFKGYVENNTCHYCGSGERRLGMDRVDSSKGYLVENIVPCCYLCNRAKSDMEYDEFIRLCSDIVKNEPTRNTKNNS